MKINWKVTLINLLMSVGASFYFAFVLMMLYNWFVPTFTGWNDLTYVGAFGISAIITLIGASIIADKDVIDGIEVDAKQQISVRISKIILYSMLLGIGAIFHAFM